MPCHQKRDSEKIIEKVVAEGMEGVREKPLLLLTFDL